MAPLVFFVNGKEIVDDHVEPDWTLLWYLRNSMYFFSLANNLPIISNQ